MPDGAALVMLTELPARPRIIGKGATFVPGPPTDAPLTGLLMQAGSLILNYFSPGNFSLTLPVPFPNGILAASLIPVIAGNPIALTIVSPPYSSTSVIGVQANEVVGGGGVGAAFEVSFVVIGW